MGYSVEISAERMARMKAVLPSTAQIAGGDIGPTVRVAPADLPAAVTAVRKTLHAPLLTMVATDDRASGHGFGLHYVFGDAPGQQPVTVVANLPAESPVFAAVTPSLPAAQWYEREAQDLFGLRADGHPDPRRLVLHEAFPDGFFPLRKDAVTPADLPRAGGEPFRFQRVEGEGVMEIPVGPIHAGIIEPAHFRLGTVGEVILHLEARLFYTHRGLEKRAEGRTLEGGLLVAERACGVCAVAHGVAYAQAAEQILGLTVPARARAIRTVLLELERLYNHVGDIGNVCAGAALMVGAAHGARLKETLQRLNERLAGNRFLRGLVRVGGVAHDFGPEAVADLRHTLLDVQGDFHNYADILGQHDSFQERLIGTGVLKRATAELFGTVGVAARASGIRRDSRVDYPHAFYAEHPPTVSLHADGDIRARVRVRLDEIADSFHLIREVLLRLPEGPVRARFGSAPAGRTGLGVTESPRGETVQWLRTDAQGRIDRWRLRSASYSNWQVVGTTGPGNMVPDFPIINKSFELCYACCDR